MLKYEIKKFSLNELKELEQYDLQYIALKQLYEKLQDKELFLKLVIINSLLSYQLSMKWEKYWFYFSSYFSKHKIRNLKEDFSSFLSEYNKRFLQAKLKRLEKILHFIENISKEKLNSYIKYEKVLLKDLSKYMRQKEDAKTIVFCIKMFIWALRIIWYDKYPSKDIYIPVDNRIWKISKNKDFWLQISEQTWYPLLILDTLFYISLSGNFENIKDQKLKTKLKQFSNFLIKNIKYTKN